MCKWQRAKQHKHLNLISCETKIVDSFDLPLVYSFCFLKKRSPLSYRCVTIVHRCWAEPRSHYRSECLQAAGPLSLVWLSAVEGGLSVRPAILQHHISPKISSTACWAATCEIDGILSRPGWLHRARKQSWETLCTLVNEIKPTRLLILWESWVSLQDGCSRRGTLTWQQTFIGTPAAIL